MTFETPNAEAIYAGLLRDYHSQLDQNNYEQHGLDPLLNTVFRLFSSRMEALYADQESVRLALLDELIRGLSVEPRRATPAQALIRFTSPGSGAATMPAGREIWYAADGEKLPFACDQAFCVSGATLAMAFAYQNKALRPLCVSDWATPANPLYPNRESTPADWGDGASILLALDNLPGGSASGLAILLDTASGSETMRRMLARSIWRMADGDGRFGAAGIFRPHPSTGAVMRLHRAFPGHEAPEDDQPVRGESLAGGAYGSSVFLFHETQENSEEFYTSCPSGLEMFLGRLFPPANAELINRKRLWLRISLTADGTDPLPQLSSAIGQIALHTMTFSNVECRDMTVRVDKRGSSIPIEFPGGGRYMVGLRAIHAGGTSTPYVPLLDASAPPESARYSVRSGRVEITPSPTDSEVNIRVWTTHGKRADNLPSNALQNEIHLENGEILKLAPVKPPKGGRNQEDRSTAEARFASAILSRGRIVTRADLSSAVRAYDSRISGVEVNQVAVRRGSTLQMLQRITLLLRGAEFPQSSWVEELRALREGLEAHLRGRLPFDMDIDIAVQWDDSHPEETAA